MEALGTDCNGRPYTNTTNLRLFQILTNYGLRNVCVRESKLIHGRGESGSWQEMCTSINVYASIYPVSTGSAERESTRGSAVTLI